MTATWRTAWGLLTKLAVELPCELATAPGDTYSFMCVCVQRKEVSIHATVWINLKSIEKSRARKVTYCMLPFLGNIQNQDRMQIGS